MNSVPGIAAVATLTAACIAAVVALVVAFVNAWSNRRIAIDTAHRAYRTQLAETVLTAMRKLLSQVDELELVSRDKDVERWRALVNEIARRRSLRQELPLSNDEVFADAVKLFVQRRGHLEMWLSISTRGIERKSEMPGFGMTISLQYINEAAKILETAAEAYIFNLPKLRRIAAKMLKEADPLALKKRIDARRKVYEDAFGPDDGQLINIDEVPAEFAQTGK